MHCMAFAIWILLSGVDLPLIYVYMDAFVCHQQGIVAIFCFTEILRVG